MLSLGNALSQSGRLQQSLKGLCFHFVHSMFSAQSVNTWPQLLGRMGSFTLHHLA